MKQEFLEHIISNMTLSEKIGQMIMIDYGNTLEMNIHLERLMTKYNIGGFILFESNIANFNQTQRLLSDIKTINNIPLMISVDQEGGRVQRLNTNVGFEKYPAMSEIGKTLDINKAYELGQKMGIELKAIGIDMNMAPVLDIFSNPQNKVIGNRSFGKTSDIVTKMALAYAKGLSNAKIISIGKHFPGHGETIKDSHIDLPIINKNIKDLKEFELIPFVEAIRKETPGLMVGHIALPKITYSKIPASLSRIMINDLLRNKMNYNGLIIPDSLKMQALTSYYSPEEIYLKSIDAGNDLLLMPEDIAKAYNTIYQNVDNGHIPIDRINASVYRILNLKFDYGLLKKEYDEYLKNSLPKKKTLSKNK